MELGKTGKLTFVIVTIYQSVNYCATDSSTIRKPLIQSDTVQYELVVDYSKIKGEFNPVLSFSGGTGDGVMNNPEFWNTLGDKFKDIHPKFMRINIFDVLYKKVDTTYKQDWDAFNTAIKRIISVGAKPFVTLFPLPEGKWTKIPRYNDNVWWEHYKQICKKIAIHLSSSNSLNLRGLYYEVWNEPDYDHCWQVDPTDAGIKWKLYNKMYKYACNGILTGDPRAKIGGPTIAKGRFSSFLKEYKNDQSQLNFISWHWYNADYQFSYYTRTAAEEALNTYDIPHSKMEYVISEYNFTSNYNEMNDCFYSAGNLAKTQEYFRADTKLSGLFFLPRDVGTRNGGCGAFTSPGDTRYPSGNLPKPSYNFFKLYSKMAGTEITVINRQSKINAWASMNDSGYRILLWSFLPSNAFGTIFNAKIALKQIPAGKYIQRNYLIDSKHGNFTYDLSHNIDSAGVLRCLEKSVVFTTNCILDQKLENGGVELIEIIPNN